MLWFSFCFNKHEILKLEGETLISWEMKDSYLFVFSQIHVISKSYTEAFGDETTCVVNEIWELLIYRKEYL